jgi:hypothetical protein
VEQQKLNDLIREMEILIATIKNSDTLISKSLDDLSISAKSDTNKLIKALGILSSRMQQASTGISKSADREIKAAKQFAKAVETSTDATEKSTDATEKSTDATKKSTEAIDTETTVRKKNIALAKEQARIEAEQRKKEAETLNDKLKNMRREQSASRQIFDQAKGMGGGLSYLKDSFLNLSKDSLSAQTGLQAIAAVAGGFSKAVMGYSKAIQQGQRGAQTSAQAFSDLAVPVSDLVGTIGTLAFIAGSGRLGLGKFAARLGLSTTALKGIGLAATVASVGLDATRVLYKEGAIQADALFDSFNSLSAAGLAQARGMDDVFETMQAIGSTTGQIEKFNSLMINNSKQIAFLGDTAGAGARQLAKVAGGLGFSKVGIEFNRMGILQEELNELTLSHLSIEARLMSQRKKSDTEQIQSTARFVDELDQASKLTGASRKEAAEAQAAALANERFRAALIDAEARGDEQELAILKRAQEVSAMFELTGNKGAATGIRDLAAGRGAPTTTEGTQVMMSMPGIMSELQDSNKGTADIVASSNNQAMEITKSLAGTLRYTGDIKAFLGTVATADTQALFAKALEKSQAEGTSITQALRELKDAQTKGTDDKGRVTQTAAMVEAGRNMLNAALVQDKTLQKLDISVKLHQLTAETYADAVKMFGKIVGGMPKNLAKTSGAEFEKSSLKIQEAAAQQRTKDVLKNTIGGSMVGKDAEAEVTRRMQDMSGQLDLASGIHKMIMKFLSPGYSEGGIASGPASGHLAMLHGTEAVIPLSGGSIPLKILGSSRDIDSGPVFNPQNETNFLLDKQNQELGKINVTLEEMLAYMLDGTISMTGSAPGVVGPGARGGAGGEAGSGAGPAIPISGELGTMSAKYESGSAGSMAVGRDRSGGTSYGKYQIASKVGSMDAFLKLLEKNDPEAYARLMASGDQDAGIQGQFAQEWKKLVSEGRIQKSEREFAVEKIFQPAMKGIKDQDLSKMIGENKGLQEMMFSMAIQHGPGGAPAILNKVYKKGMKADELVNAAYEERGADKGQRYFGKSTENERAGVVSRFGRERQDVLAMLGQPGTPTAPVTTATAAAAPGTTAAAPVATAAAPAAAPGTTAAAASSGGLMNIVGGMLGLSGPTAQKASAGPGGLTDLISGAGSGIMGMLGLGAAPTSPGQPTMAGVPAGGQPGAIGTDISAITQAMQAQTAATQSAITTGMQDLTTRLVDKIGSGGSGGTAADPAVPTLLGDILSASREQTSAINRLIQVQTS